MDRTLHLVGKNSSEIILVKYPRSLLNFCEYDLAYFAENAIAICDDALKEGELDFDRVTDLRNTLKSAHVYIENNIRTVYDKIVIDCWIDYVCRRDNVGTGTLWNRFLPCSTAFEKAVFVRLCDYRYKRGINEWLNLVRVQDYAKNKISFLFSMDINSADEAAARRNYFDLMFSVTARELGCRIEEMGVTKVFSVGRIPSAPFMFPNISKDVVKNLLADFDYSEDYSDTDNYAGLSDQIAMDAFSYMKSGLAQEYNSYNISRSEMENSPVKVYMPCGLKAVVDLEIDALIESGGWLSRCKRCGRYFVRDSEHMAEYCSLFNPGGKTCLQIYEAEHPKSLISPALEKSFREITDEMYNRVDESMTLSEYESWKIYLDALHEKVGKGEIPVEELEDFINYSRSMDISKSNPVKVVAKKATERPTRERVVKPFVPKRIDRSELEAQKPKEPVEEEPQDELFQQRGKSFFTSPSVQSRKASHEPTPVTRIIRAEQSAEVLAPKTNKFTPFGQTEPEYTPPAEPVFERPATPAFDAPQRTAPMRETARPAEAKAPAAPSLSPTPIAEELSEIDFERISEKLSQLREMSRSAAAQAMRPAEPTGFVQNTPPVLKQPAAPRQKPVEQPAFDVFGDVSYETSDTLETYGNVFDLERNGTEAMPEPVIEEQPSVRPKVIRKNAAAISAYGKMSGAPVQTVSGFNAIIQPEPEPVADSDPFKNVSAIFDDIEGVTPAPAVKAEVEAVAEPEPVFVPVSEPPVISQPKKRSAPKRSTQPREIPDKVTEDNAPSGIWAEERNLFPEVDPEELEMLKDKKRSRSNKTQRLFDAIMREPEDNPNVRKSKK